MKKMILVIGEADAFGEAAIAELKTNYTVQSAPDAAHAKGLAQILSPALLVAFPEWINMDTVSEYEDLIDTFPSIPFAVMGSIPFPRSPLRSWAQRRITHPRSSASGGPWRTSSCR